MLSNVPCGKLLGIGATTMTNLKSCVSGIAEYKTHKQHLAHWRQFVAFFLKFLFKVFKISWVFAGSFYVVKASITWSSFRSAKIRSRQSHLVPNCKLPSPISLLSAERSGPGPVPEKRRREDFNRIVNRHNNRRGEFYNVLVKKLKQTQTTYSIRLWIFARWFKACILHIANVDRTRNKEHDLNVA